MVLHRGPGVNYPSWMLLNAEKVGAHARINKAQNLEEFGLDQPTVCFFLGKKKEVAGIKVHKTTIQVKWQEELFRKKKIQNKFEYQIKFGLKLDMKIHARKFKKGFVFISFPPTAPKKEFDHLHIMTNSTTPVCIQDTIYRSD